MRQYEPENMDAPGLESMLEVKCEALLHDLLGKHGPGDTAKMLGVNYKTVARSVDSGKLSVHLREALMGWLLARRDDHPAPREESVDPAATVEKLSVEIGGALGDLSREMRSGFDSLGRQQTRGLEKLATRLSAMVGQPDAGNMVRLTGTDMTWPRGTQPRPKSRTADPTLVTTEAQEGESEVYGPAWSTVQEWRELRLGHPYEGSGVDWLEGEKRLRKLEIVLIEEHGLTLPPDRNPWDCLERKTQVNWRHETIYRLRKEIFRARLRRWLRRVFTVGLWRE